VWAQAPSEPYSSTFYAACTAGGIASCGLTHMTVTPLDLIDPTKYKSISSVFGVLLKEQGATGFFRGWVPTLLGYMVTALRACASSFFFFKKYCYDIAGPNYAAMYKTLIYLARSASAEVIVDVALCPMEAVKVRVQTQPGFARLYKGIVPLWGRQIPYTMMKFASFETVVEMIYKYAIPSLRISAANPCRFWVSFAGGYIAGVFYAIVSHPADNLVSSLMPRVQQPV
ncbi:hypothetical protein ABZP36_003428, partial [Zizania latifolia]